MKRNEIIENYINSLNIKFKKYEFDAVYGYDEITETYIIKTSGNDFNNDSDFHNSSFLFCTKMAEVEGIWVMFVTPDDPIKFDEYCPISKYNSKPNSMKSPEYTLSSVKSYTNNTYSPSSIVFKNSSYMYSQQDSNPIYPAYAA